ncbi:conserved hypothetical protein [Candidatus Denitrolinea symbiosum]|nr:conserved hypothetical protein [Candidatus Denitrolinea symbiosum]
MGEFDNPMARIYLGAIFVLGDSKNPDRLALAAHNFRELLSRLPKRLGLDTKSFQEKLDSELFSLREQWDRAQRNSKCRRSDSWDGEIDPPLLKFLSLIPTFFDWYDSIRPRRKQVVTRALRKLDPAPVNLPSHIEQEHWQEWQALYSYFAAVAHHEKHVNMEEFQSQVNRLEIYLVTRLRPRTFEDIKDIENLIRRAEGND